MKIGNEKIVLRDFVEADIQRRILWETEETEWKLWDGPWEYEGKSKEELIHDLERYITTMKAWVEKFKNKPDAEMRWSFQITINNDTNDYIGWCSAYNIDENYEFSKNTNLCAVGIDIPVLSAREKGYASSALSLFISYLLESGIKDIYTQTWSGNKRMIGLAQKLGFEECGREKENRMVRGKKYDGLTFRLNRDKFNKYYMYY